MFVFLMPVCLAATEHPAAETVLSAEDISSLITQEQMTVDKAAGITGSVPVSADDTDADTEEEAAEEIQGGAADVNDTVSGETEAPAGGEQPECSPIPDEEVTGAGDMPSETIKPTSQPEETEFPERTEQPERTELPNDIEDTEENASPEATESPGETEITDDMAGQDNGPSGSETSKQTPVRITDMISVSDELIFREVGESVDTSELPQSTYIQTDTSGVLKCDIVWENDIDVSEPGRKTVKGRLVLPEGYCFAEGENGYTEAAYLFFESGGGGVEAAHPEESVSDTLLVPLGADPKDYINTGNQVKFKTEHGDTFYCGIDWGELDIMNEEGEHSVTGRYILPDGIFLEDGFSPYYTQKLFVMSDDEISLGYAISQNGMIMCQWIKDIDDIENVSVYYKIGDGDWTEDTDMEYGTLVVNAFSVRASALKADTDYYFRLGYNGSLTDILHVNIDEDEIKTELLEGDRDGGDNEDQDIPPYKHPAPPSVSRPNQGPDTTDNEADADGDDMVSQQPEKSDIGSVNAAEIEETGLPDVPPQDEIPGAELREPEESTAETASPADNGAGGPVSDEEITDTKTVLTGRRLMQMSENQGGMPAFEKNGIVLELPPGFIEDNDIRETDMVSVELARHDASAQIDVKVNGGEVTGIPGAMLHLPEPEAVIAMDGAEIEAASRGNGEAVFRIEKTGEYDIENASEDEGDGNGTAPAAILTAGAAALAVCLLLFGRKAKRWIKR